MALYMTSHGKSLMVLREDWPTLDELEAAGGPALKLSAGG